MFFNLIQLPQVLNLSGDRDSRGRIAQNDKKIGFKNINFFYDDVEPCKTVAIH